MTLKRVLLGLVVIAALSTPASARTFSVYGSYWDADEADHSGGFGVRMGFPLVKMLELDVHATYFNDFNGADPLTPGTSVKINALPLDVGLRINFAPDSKVNPHVGLGFTRYFLGVDDGEIDDDNGWYVGGGLDFGEDDSHFFVEALWRQLSTAVSLSSITNPVDTDFDGATINAGWTWSWGS